MTSPVRLSVLPALNAVCRLMVVNLTEIDSKPTSRVGIQEPAIRDEDSGRIETHPQACAPLSAARRFL